MAFRPPAGALWPLAIAGCIAVAGPLAAADGLLDSGSRPQAATIFEAPPSTRVSIAGDRRASAAFEISARKKKARAKPKPRAKAASKSAKPLPKAKPQTETAAVPLPAARPDAAGPPAFSPAVAAAVQPALPKDNIAAPTTPPIPPVAPHVEAVPAPARTIIKTAAIDVAATKRAIEMVRARKTSAAGDVSKTIADPVAQRLIEWVTLRSDDAGATFARYAAFIVANPDWPSIVTLRRKAEAMAFNERPDPARLLAFFEKWPPLSARGKFALARALLQQGDDKGAAAVAREAWRLDSFPEDMERRALEAFGEVLTRDDHKARMDRRLYDASDSAAGLRMASRLGGHAPAIAKARIATVRSGTGKAAVEAVPAAARDDVGYKFARAQMLRRSGKFADAAALMRTVPSPLDDSHDADEWWIERRVLARELLEAGNPKLAYEVARGATPPSRDAYRVQHQFTAGWIALRFLKDPAAAYAHFREIPKMSGNPISLARGHYWMGRAAEALNRPQDARRHYLDAARHPTAYYGQIARAKAGLGELTLNPFPALSDAERARIAQIDVVRAAELLYAIDAHDLAWIMMADLGDKSDDANMLAFLAELTAKYRDARGMLLVGKLALARGLALDHAAFPTMGVPDYKPIGPEVEPAIVYSIVRQESWFNPRTISSAKAMGLMQVTPPTARHLARKYSVKFDQRRLLNDIVYNVQFGAAMLGDVIKDYRGSYILAFVAYNAGPGRVRDWISRFGDPRDPKVDPIDWVEKIPFSETRNYVQRAMENVQVYRVRFGGTRRLLIEADMRRGSRAN